MRLRQTAIKRAKRVKENEKDDIEVFCHEKGNESFKTTYEGNFLMLNMHPIHDFFLGW
jgi:hypothetical protein